MADLIIKPSTGPGNKLILQDQAGGAILTTADSGASLNNLTGTISEITPGTSGNLLTSDGTNWSSAAAPAAGGTLLSMTVYDTGSGNYTVGEQVYQGTSLAAATVKGEVASWNATDKLLNLINMTGNFSGVVNIIGDSSSASYSISSFDAQSSAADTAATATNVEIEAAADAIIDFTEGNPFGSL